MADFRRKGGLTLAESPANNATITRESPVFGTEKGRRRDGEGTERIRGFEDLKI